MKTKLYEIRKAIGLTQAQAAKECGVCERTYRDLENGTINRANAQETAAEAALTARAKKRAREVLILANQIERRSQAWRERKRNET